MTPKLLDSGNDRSLRSDNMVFPTKKKSVWGQFFSAPDAHPLKNANSNFIVVRPSLQLILQKLEGVNVIFGELHSKTSKG